jgi:hypothetical protein
MRAAALVPGIAGGLLGLFDSVQTLARDGAATLGGPQGTALTGRGGLGVVLAFLAIAGGVIAISKPRLAALALLSAGLGGLLAVGGFYLMASPLLLVGALLAFLARSPKAATPLL